MKLLTIIGLFSALIAVGCKSAQSQITAQTSTSPSPTIQTNPTLKPMTAKEHWDASKELMAEKIYSPEDLIEFRKHLTAVANSKIPERHRAATALKRLPKLEAEMPTGDALKSAQQICTDVSGVDVTVLTEELMKSLHDPSSLRDFKVKKCVPNGSDGQGVVLLASYRAKNTYGALILNEDQFLVVRSTDGKTKYKALVWVSEK